MNNENLRDSVKARYGEAAQRVADDGAQATCCGSSGCCGATTEAWDPITANLYDEGQTAGVPAKALLASLGCGNPTALAELREGETVLDLGSGGGIDVLLSARRVGPTGKAYGLDMTDEMLALANDNRATAGAENVEFLKGEIEHIPLPDASVDVIISNCVINLSGDKRQVLREAFRVLKPGGRFAVSDVVVRGDVPEAVRRNMELWMGCVAGALGDEEFLELLRDVGFENPSIEPTRVYSMGDAVTLLAHTGLDAESLGRQIDGKFMSGFVRATKPRADSTEGPPLLRAAASSDIAGIEALLRASDLPLVGVRDALPNFVVAEDAGAIVGVAGLEIHDGHALLRSVAVAPPWRSRGLGRTLVERMIAQANARGLESIHLLTTTADRYFPTFGFAPISREEVPSALRASEEFTTACPASATVMRLLCDRKSRDGKR